MVNNHEVSFSISLGVDILVNDSLVKTLKSVTDKIGRFSKNNFSSIPNRGSYMSKLLAAIVAGMFAIGTTGVFAAADTGAPKDAPKKLSAAECKDPKNKDHADCKPAAKKDEMKK